MCYPVGDKERLSTISEWIVILFAWDDLFDVPEDNLMDDAGGAKAINNVVLSIFDTPETSETQAELTVVAAFRAYVNPLARFAWTSDTECFTTDSGLVSVPHRPRLCKSVL